MTTAYACPWILTPEGWQADCLLKVDKSGRIAAIETSGWQSCDAVMLAGPVIPGMCNVHSHAHQRLIAGLTGRRKRGESSFWSWREQMYRAVGLLRPDDLTVLANFLYMELLEGGYTSNGEFHYAHRLDRSELIETSQALLEAAGSAGCGLTLLPVWYRYSGFGRAEPLPEQRPFTLEANAFVALVKRLQALTAADDHLVIGMAPHSLRAVDLAELPEVLSALPGIPVHLHIAEQPAEVAACLEATGHRPIEWLFERVAPDRRWCLIHATHATGAELDMMAKAAVVAGICPTTEADLGDGIFATRAWLDLGGRLAIGSDSNLVTSAATELRLLEWGQRLESHQRNVLASAEGGHIGSALWQQAARDGARALAQPAGQLIPGCRADFVVLNGRHPLLQGLDPDSALDSFIFAEQAGMIDAVYVAGNARVTNGSHPDRAALSEKIIQMRQRLQQLETR